MRVLLFLLLSLFMLPAFSADNLLRWHDSLINNKALC